MEKSELSEWNCEAPARGQLELLAEPSYRAFSEKLLPGTSCILGVRLPTLRRLAKQIAKGDWRGYLAQACDDTFEEIMLQGLVLGCAKAESAELLDRTANFIPKIDNWSVCDSFCAGFRLAKREPTTVWNFLVPYLESGREFDCRFGVVMLLDHYCCAEYLERTLLRLAQVHAQGYYAKMAAAWAISECFAKDPFQTLAYLEQPTWDDFIHNKAIQKITESLRVPDDLKALARSLKRTAPA
ncbi:DNA alkylation repair protein [Faecalispora anaeroviscerum]|uniref:DNA alkylation repair protein n=1 Tax=Faecalispora anaeroviscerum TaxID=2991836 RepID=UPI0024B91C8A|nr:DNA alkylation repair protein [Faecalispora anaeroviscerum]